MKKLLIHIGPPKTATTSLQYWLEENIGFYTYIGVLQPRIKKTLLNSMLSNYFNGKINIEEITRVLEESDSKNILIYSEEMLLTNNWLDKVDRIKLLSKNFDIYTCYCFRNTQKVLPSYYAEIHSNLPKVLKADYHEFLLDLRVKAYDLEFIYDTFKKHKIKLNIFTFKSLTSKDISLNEMFGIHEHQKVFKKKIVLKQENTRNKKDPNTYLVIDKKPQYPKYFSKILKKIEKKLNISIKHLFKNNYYLKIMNNKIVDTLENRNNLFFDNYINDK
jgi:hypothetical protein